LDETLAEQYMLPTFRRISRKAMGSIQGALKQLKWPAARRADVTLQNRIQPIVKDQNMPAAGGKITVNVTWALTGERLPAVSCKDSDLVSALGQIVAAQADSGDKENGYYTIMHSDGSTLLGSQTLAEAEITDGGEVSVVCTEKPKPSAPEVQFMRDIWRHNPGTRYPVTLNVSKPRFYATKECKDEDEVTFGNIDFGGGFQRIFINKEGRPKDHISENYLPVFELSTGQLHIVSVLADEARFGGIVIQPLDRS